MKSILIYMFVLLLTSGCNDKSNNNDGLTWLNVSDNEKFKVIERQFRGFDKTMMEVGYRYNELYWAGEDQNWELAKYHIEKIEHTIKLGTERRSKRKDNAQMIFPVLGDLKTHASSNNQMAFRENYKILRQACNACHHAEDVSYFNVELPTVRLSPLKGVLNGEK